MGTPPSAQKAFQPTGSDVNAFFPSTTRIHVGDSVRFLPVGFHNLDLPKKGGKPTALIAPQGAALSRRHRRGGRGLLVQRPAEPQFNARAGPGRLRQEVHLHRREGRAERPAAGPEPKPVTVKFAKTGSFTYYCDVHPGMKGIVTVKSKSKSRRPRRTRSRSRTRSASAGGGQDARPRPRCRPTRSTSASPARAASSCSPSRRPRARCPRARRVTFRMSPGTYEVHTATSGPGDPREGADRRTSARSPRLRGRAGPRSARRVPERGRRARPRQLTPTLHGNGFWNSGVLDASSATPLPRSNTVTFGAAGDVRLLLHDPPVHERHGHRPVRRAARSWPFWLNGGGGLGRRPRAGAATREFWVAAVPVTLEHRPQRARRDHGTTLDPSQTVFPTVVYRRFTPHWRTPLPNTPRGRQPGPHPRAAAARPRRRPAPRALQEPGPRATRPHSMHFHGVHYKPSSDGAYVPGFSGRDGDVMPGQTLDLQAHRRPATPSAPGPTTTTRRRWRSRSTGGMYGMLSILGRHEQAPDREFVVVFAPMGEFQTIDGRAFVGNTPVFTLEGRRPRPVGRDGDGLRAPHLPRPRPPLAHAGGIPRDTQTVGPAETLPHPLEGGGPRARGSTTATSSPTWRRA